MAAHLNLFQFLLTHISLDDGTTKQKVQCWGMRCQPRVNCRRLQHLWCATGWCNARRLALRNYSGSHLRGYMADFRGSHSPMLQILVVFRAKALLRPVPRSNSSRRNDLEPPEWKCGFCDVTPHHGIRCGEASLLQLRSLDVAVPRV